MPLASLDPDRNYQPVGWFQKFNLNFQSFSMVIILSIYNNATLLPWSCDSPTMNIPVSFHGHATMHQLMYQSPSMVMPLSLNSHTTSFHDSITLLHAHGNVTILPFLCYSPSLVTSHSFHGNATLLPFSCPFSYMVMSLYFHSHATLLPFCQGPSELLQAGL